MEQDSVPFGMAVIVNSQILQTFLLSEMMLQ